MPRSPSIYDQVVKISADFLGPAGERFIRRQIDTHLGIEPEQLHGSHLPELVSWIRPTFALLTDDTVHVEAFADRLLALSGHNPYTRTKHGGSR